jgi:hypothetical protein
VALVSPKLFQRSPAYLTAAVVVVPRTQILAVQLLLVVAWEAAVQTALQLPRTQAAAGAVAHFRRSQAAPAQPVLSSCVGSCEQEGLIRL